jgi:hypothetical protein
MSEPLTAGQLLNDQRFYLRWGVSASGCLIAAFIRREKAEQFAACGRAEPKNKGMAIAVVPLVGHGTVSYQECWDASKLERIE